MTQGQLSEREMPELKDRKWSLSAGQLFMLLTRRNLAQRVRSGENRGPDRRGGGCAKFVRTIAEFRRPDPFSAFCPKKGQAAEIRDSSHC